MLLCQSFIFQEFHHLVQGGAAANECLVEAGTAILAQQNCIAKSHLKITFKCVPTFVPSLPACLLNSTVVASELGNYVC
jgi:hypothetical protein